MLRLSATELIKNTRKLVNESRTLCDASRRSISLSKQAIAYGKAMIKRQKSALNQIHLAELKDFPGQSRELEKARPSARTERDTYSRDFMEFVHKELWRIAARLPRLEKALVEAGVPRTFPPKPQDHFLTTKAKQKRRTLH
jgi:hypothetical protein